MIAYTEINDKRPDETLVEVYDSPDDEHVLFWGGVNQNGDPYIVYCPRWAPRFSVKQERFFKVFLLAAHIEFSLGGTTIYEPSNPFDAYKVVFPPEQFPFGAEQKLPKFKVYS